MVYTYDCHPFMLKKGHSRLAGKRKTTLKLMDAVTKGFNGLVRLRFSGKISHISYFVELANIAGICKISDKLLGLLGYLCALLNNISFSFCFSYHSLFKAIYQSLSLKYWLKRNTVKCNFAKKPCLSTRNQVFRNYYSYINNYESTYFLIYLKLTGRNISQKISPFLVTINHCRA